MQIAYSFRGWVYYWNSGKLGGRWAFLSSSIWELASDLQAASINKILGLMWTFESSRLTPVTHLLQKSLGIFPEKFINWNPNIQIIWPYGEHPYWKHQKALNTLQTYLGFSQKTHSSFQKSLQF